MHVSRIAPCPAEWTLADQLRFLHPLYCSFDCLLSGHRLAAAGRAADVFRFQADYRLVEMLGSLGNDSTSDP